MIPKPEPLKRVRTRKRRHEAAVKHQVRELVAARDGYCRMAAFDAVQCQGPGEWAHFGEGRRSKTRGMDPARRHTTTWSVMLCRFHHTLEERHRLWIEPLTDQGADGPMRWRADNGRTFVE